jgi:hypothetical protein
MEKKNLLKKIIAVSIVVTVLVMVFISVYLTVNQPKMLYPGEIQNYQGENLSSIADVRENAIGGTQHINLQPTA